MEATKFYVRGFYNDEYIADGVKNTEENVEQELDLEGLDDGELDKVGTGI